MYKTTFASQTQLGLLNNPSIYQYRVCYRVLTSIINPHALKTAQHTEHFGPQQGIAIFTF